MQSLGWALSGCLESPGVLQTEGYKGHSYKQKLTCDYLEGQGDLVSRLITPRNRYNIPNPHY